MATDGIDIIADFQRSAPGTPGVYRMLDGAGRVLYVGKAKNLAKRIRNYTDPSRLSDRIRKMVFETRAMEIVGAATETEALLLEQGLIKRMRPKYNILMRDDKSYPYLAISKGDFPRVGKFRGAKNSSLHFFGPFPAASAVDEGVRVMQSAFGLRTCSDSNFKNRRAPCLLYQIKRCSGPCCGKISPEDYRARAGRAVMFMKGKSRELIDELSALMRKASDDKDYELAGAYRDEIAYLSKLLKKSSLASLSGDTDVVAVAGSPGLWRIEVLFSRSSMADGSLSYTPSNAEGAGAPEILRAFLEQFYAQSGDVPGLILTNVDLGGERGELEGILSAIRGSRVAIEVPARGARKNALDTILKNGEAKLSRKLEGTEYLAELARLFGLPAAPGRVDLFDNSHISGTTRIGAMVVAGPGGFMRDDYRKYNITMTDRGDDLRMMEETLSRRYARAIAENTLPDLILLDGGSLQLEVASRVLRRLELDIPVVGIAKTEGHDAGAETLVMRGRPEIRLDRRSPVLFYLERLRDEVHRFAITSHRKKREKSAFRSALDDIGGIGPAKKKALLGYFGSVRNIADADLGELEKAGGISRSLARKIYDNFH